jgi:predicted Fe-S protein YdhL (DUF1289 family)
MTSCCKICKLDWNKDYCLGCGRTVDEIRQAYSDMNGRIHDRCQEIDSLDKRSSENGTSTRPLSANKTSD